MFHFCESCSLGSGARTVLYVGLESCSFSDARNSIAAKPGCSVTQVSGRQQCEGR